MSGITGTSGEEPYVSCAQCPRSCRANRSGGESGACGETFSLRVASAGLHFGEEPVITVRGGSGTVFFTGCTLRCAFCQNYQISQQGMGAPVDSVTFTEICLRLQALGAENINLVTGSHHIPLIARYIEAAKTAGLSIPVAWNSSAYESVESLERLKGLVDIWLPDLKTLNGMMARELFGVDDYPRTAKRAVRWMLESTPMRIVRSSPREEPSPAADESSPCEKMLSGTIIRHLFLPGRIQDTALTLDWLKAHADGKACVSLMSQYTPVPFKSPPPGSSCPPSHDEKAREKKLSAFKNRLVTPQEDSALREMIDSYGFEYLFYQDLSDDTSWLPDFSRSQPFSNSLARPIWHWSTGFIKE